MGAARSPRTPARGHRAMPRAAAFALAALSAAALAASCVERRSPVEITAHPPEWNQVGSVDFHGARVMRDTPSSCATCHSADLRGEPGAPGCDDCHAGAGGHPFGWADSASSSPFHGDAVELNGPPECRICHGEDYRGGWSQISCYRCHAGGPSGHPDGWLTRVSSSFHGLKVFREGVERCTACHGFGLGGGTSGVACAECHGVPIAAPALNASGFLSAFN